MQKPKNDRHPLSVVGRPRLVERRTATAPRGTYLPRGTVCQLINGVVTPGFDPTLSDRPYVTVTCTGNYQEPDKGFDYSYTVPRETEFANMFDNEPDQVVLIALDQPAWFVLERFNFPTDQINTLQVGDWLTCGYGIEDGAITYPADRVGRWDRTPAVEEMPPGSMLPIIGVIRDVTDGRVIVRSRAVSADSELHTLGGYDQFPAILYQGAWDVELGWDRPLNWDQEI